MTHQQAKLLAFIRDYQKSHLGATPSYTEMASALGLKSRASIPRLIASLRRDGLVVHSQGHARSIIIRPERPLPAHVTTVAEIRKRDVTVPEHVAETQRWAWLLGYELLLRASS